MAKSEIREWMPLEIARFYSSPRVRNMRDFQRWWYIALLMEAWQSDPPCHLSADQEQLRMIAGANQSDWEKHSNLVLGCFDAVEGTNMIVNRAQLEIYNEKMASREGQKAGGRKGAESRWERHRSAIGNLSEAINSPSVSESKEVLPFRKPPDFSLTDLSKLLCDVFHLNLSGRDALQLGEEIVSKAMQAWGIEGLPAIDRITENWQTFRASKGTEERFKKNVRKWLADGDWNTAIIEKQKPKPLGELEMLICRRNRVNYEGRNPDEVRNEIKGMSPSVIN